MREGGRGGFRRTEAYSPQKVTFVRHKVYANGSSIISCCGSIFFKLDRTFQNAHVVHSRAAEEQLLLSCTASSAHTILQQQSHMATWYESDTMKVFMIK